MYFSLLTIFFIVLILAYTVYCIVKQKPVYNVVIGIIIFIIIMLMDRIFIEHESLGQAIIHLLPSAFTLLLIITGYIVYCYRNKP